ncbi:uncharacterized protein [Diabrotica undecimpunctata]|uniref:uncharacterized protein n=1 Tax=Diabrotica undecimpunctata TaxID=50387 RepID=UPI003B63772A
MEDMVVCDNYRGNTLLNIAYKVLANALYQRMLPYTVQIVGGYQYGFWPNKSTMDQIFAVRQIFETTLEFGVDTHHIFVDSKAAYYTVNRYKLLLTMVEFQIPFILFN